LKIGKKKKLSVTTIKQSKTRTKNRKTEKGESTRKSYWTSPPLYAYAKPEKPRDEVDTKKFK